MRGSAGGARLLTFLVLAFPRGAAAIPIDAPYVDPVSGWQTQDWTQRGAGSWNLHLHLAEFTAHEYWNPNAGVSPGGGDPTGAFVLPSAWRINIGTPIYGEATVARVAGLRELGPHGLVVVPADDGMRGYSTAGFPFYEAFDQQTYWQAGCRNNPSRLDEDSACDTPYTSPVALFPINEEVTTETNRVNTFVATIGGSAFCPNPNRYFLDVAMYVNGQAKTMCETARNQDIFPNPATFPAPNVGAVSQPVCLDLLQAVYATDAAVDVCPWGNTFCTDDYIDFDYPGLLVGTEWLGGTMRWYAPLVRGSCVPRFGTTTIPQCTGGGTNLPPGGLLNNAVFYRPTTSPSVNGDLVVVGGTAIDGSDSRLFAFDSQTGAKRWEFPTIGEVLPSPGMISDLLILVATDEGYVYCLLRSTGQLLWRSDQILYRPRPFTSPNWWAPVRLAGPALDQDLIAYAYYGGSDGRVHQFEVLTGAWRTSGPRSAGGDSSEEPIFYWRAGTDINGNQIYEPCSITTSPVVHQDRFLLVKSHTAATEGWQQLYAQNVSVLTVMSIPDMQYRPVADAESRTANIAGLSLDPAAADFRRGNNRYDHVFLHGGGVNFGISYVDNVEFLSGVWGGGFLLDAGGSDGGGVSMAQGFAFATDRSGTIVAIPSSEVFTVTSSTAIGTATATAPPPPLVVTPPLGPIEVYPNPFDPRRAVNGVAKFRNLPRGTVVELYTLAYERVRTLPSAGHQADWDGKNEAGQDVASGVYLYKILEPGKAPVHTGRLALIRR